MGFTSTTLLFIFNRVSAPSRLRSKRLLGEEQHVSDPYLSAYSALSALKMDKDSTVTYRDAVCCLLKCVYSFSRPIPDVLSRMKLYKLIDIEQVDGKKMVRLLDRGSLVMRFANSDDHTLAMMMSREKFRRDQASEKAAAKRKGSHERALQIARKLLVKMPDEEIAEDTGLTVEQVAELRAEAEVQDSSMS